MNFKVAALMDPGHKGKLILLYGPGGIGKTSLALLFDAPFIIKTEDGTESVTALERINPNFKRDSVFSFRDESDKEVVLKSTADVLSGIDYLREAKHTRQTLILDSGTAYNVLGQTEVLAEEPNAKLRTMANAHGGYGKAWGLLASKNRELLDRLRLIIEERAMDVVVTFHEMIEEVTPPDNPPYSRAVLRLHKGSEKSQDTNIQSMWTEAADCVAYLKQEGFVSDDRAMTSKNRFIHCYADPANAGKNRWGISEPIRYDLTGNPFGEYLK